jgi:hypothetical protein
VRGTATGEVGGNDVAGVNVGSKQWDAAVQGSESNISPRTQHRGSSDAEPVRVRC